MYSPIQALLERAGYVPICIAGIMLLLGYYEDGASCGFVVTLRYRLAEACPLMVWLLQQLPAAPHAKARQILCRFP